MFFKLNNCIYNIEQIIKVRINDTVVDHETKRPYASKEGGFVHVCMVINDDGYIVYEAFLTGWQSIQQMFFDYGRGRKYAEISTFTMDCIKETDRKYQLLPDEERCFH